MPLGASWVPPGCLLGAFWMPLGCLLGVSWVPLGCLLGVSWVFFTAIHCRSCVGSPRTLLHCFLICVWEPRLELKCSLTRVITSLLRHCPLGPLCFELRLLRNLPTEVFMFSRCKCVYFPSLYMLCSLPACLIWYDTFDIGLVIRHCLVTTTNASFVFLLAFVSLC